MGNCDDEEVCLLMYLKFSPIFSCDYISFHLASHSFALPCKIIIIVIIIKIFILPSVSRSSSLFFHYYIPLPPFI